MTDFTSALSGTFVDPYRELTGMREGVLGQSSSNRDAAIAAARGVSGMVTSIANGTLVDVPLALSEGFRNTPRLYGEKVKSQETVTDWKSGSVVAAKVCPLTPTITADFSCEMSLLLPCYLTSKLSSRILALAFMKALLVLSANLSKALNRKELLVLSKELVKAL